MRKVVAWMTGVSLLLAGRAAGAVAQAPADTTGCDRAIGAVATGDTVAARETYATIPRCGDRGLQALVMALRNAKSGAPVPLVDLVVGAHLLRSDRIFDEAALLAAATRAPAPARIAGLTILAGQLGNDSSVPDPAEPCLANPRDAPTMPVGALSADRAQRGYDLLAAIANDRADPPPVRQAARCLAGQLLHPAPPDARPEEIRVEALCGREVRVRSTAPDSVMIEVRETESGETSHLAIAAGTTREFTTTTSGTVEFSLGGKRLWVRPATTARCP